MNRTDMSPLTVLPTEKTTLFLPLTSTILSAEQMAALAAAVDRIIPPDTESPGGADGGSLAYIVRHLEDGGNLASFRDEYHLFLDTLRAAGFTSLDDAAQDTLFAGMAQSEHFFRLFAEHAQEGYYTNPNNWPSIGFIVTG